MPAPVDAPEGEPDYRFTLANERTFLAWTRTALALIAGGVAAGHLLDTGDATAPYALLSLTCLLAAVAIAVGGQLHWRRNQRTIRQQGALPYPMLLPLLTVSTVVVAGLGLWGAVLT